MASFTKIKANNKQGYKWICTKDGPADPATGKRKQIARRGDTQKEAKGRVDEAIKTLVKTKLDEKTLKKKTFEIVAQEWLPVYARRKVKKATVRIRSKEIKILKRFIGKTGITDITLQKHQSILNDMFDEGYARSTIEGVHVTANMIYKHAIKEKYITDNPCTGAIVPQKPMSVEELEKLSIEHKYLTQTELQEFLESVQTHGLEDDIEIFWLLAFSGMRSGELCALLTSVLNFEINTIKIIRTLDNPDNNMRKYELTTPKTPASAREFVLEAEIMDMLQALIQRKTYLKKAAREITDDICEDDFVFCRANGYPYIQKTILRRMKRILDKTSIVKEVTPHIFRHTHISMLAEAGVDLPTIMQKVGHDDMDTTLKIYLHVTKQMKQTASGKVSTTFSPLLQLIQK